MDIEAMLKNIMTEEARKVAVNPVKVIKTFPVKKEWAKDMKSAQEKVVKIGLMLKEIMDDRNRMWTKIKLDTNVFSDSLRWSEDSKSIEQVEEIN